MSEWCIRTRVTPTGTSSAHDTCRHMQVLTKSLIQATKCRYPLSPRRMHIHARLTVSKQIGINSQLSNQANRMQAQAQLTIRADACKCVLSPQYAYMHVETYPPLDTRKHLQIHAHFLIHANKRRYKHSLNTCALTLITPGSQYAQALADAQISGSMQVNIRRFKLSPSCIGAHADKHPALVAWGHAQIHTKQLVRANNIQLKPQLSMQANERRYTLCP